MPITDLEFIFLGTGTSAGVPVIACECAVCRSTDPRDKRTRTGAAMRFIDGNNQPRVILLDATPDLREQALRHKLTRCDAILFTHNHVDHTFGLDEVRRFNAVMRAPIDIHADPHTMETLQRIYRHIFERDKNVNDSFVATLLPHLLDTGGAGVPPAILDLFGLRFTPLKLLHGRAPVLGFRIDETPSEPSPLVRREHEGAAEPSPPGRGQGEGAAEPSPPGRGQGEGKHRARTSSSISPHPDSTELVAGRPLSRRESGEGDSILPLAYCTDVSAIPPETWPRLRGLSTLVLDLLRFRAHPTHFSYDEAVSTAERIGARQTYFIHMAHDILHAEVDAQLPEGMHLAYDGLVLRGNPE